MSLKIFNFFLLLLILQACAPNLKARKATDADFQPFYYSYMEPGGVVDQAHTNSQIRFKGSYDNESPNMVFFMIEPHNSFINAANKTSIVIYSGGLGNVSCSQAPGGVNEIDCLFRGILNGNQRAQEACANSMVNTGGAVNVSAERFVGQFTEFANNMSHIKLGTNIHESVFEIPNFFVNGVQRYTHAIFIPDLNLFCSSNATGVAGACMGSDGLPASHCYYVAELPTIPALTDNSNDGF